jgi:uncharacterized protein YqgV (UPF0045/DUF77 family)
MPHEAHPMGTVVEGTVDECLDLLREILDKSLSRSPRVILNAKLDVRPGEYNRLEKKRKRIRDELAEVEKNTPETEPEPEK